MQLLQKLRDSSAIDSLVGDLERVEREARGLTSKIIGFLNQCSGPIIIYSYTGYGYTPASLLYWSSLIFQSSRHPVLAESEEVSIYLLPYREDYSVIVFSTGEYSKLIQSIQVMRLLGVNYYAIAPKPPTGSIESMARHYGVEIIPVGNLVEATLYMTLASFFTASELYKTELNARGKRLFEHGREGFAFTVKSFIEKYVEVLEAVSSKSPVVVTSTRFLEAPSILLSNVLREHGLASTYLPLEEALSIKQRILGVFASTDERVRREFKTRSLGEGLELLLNLEPLEAIVYLAILSYVLYKLKQ
jgi:hypothetical protein